MRWIGLFLCAAFALAMPNPSLAQSPARDNTATALSDGPATLIADEIYVTADGQLIAEGNVEAYQGGLRMTARRAIFDRDAGTFSIEGPIKVDDGSGVTILASAAEMEDGLRDGLLTGARLVFDQHLQLASNQINRVGDRYTQLYKTAVTSCKVCEDGRPPLWQIRARRVIHDEAEQQLYFEDAQFRILEVPVFYLPAFRIPDPTLRRASGFLIPSIRSTSQLGTGLKVPYFFTLGDRADLTLSPYLSPDTRTLEYRYRHAFRRGRYEFEGAFTGDDLRPGETRGYLFGTGDFFVENDYQLSFDIEAASDDAYLLDYSITDDDRLEIQMALSRTKRDSFFGATAIYYNSIRDSDDNDLLPTIVADVAYLRRFFPVGLGGELRLSALAHTHMRESNQDILGRDLARSTADITYLQSWTFRTGLRTDMELGIALDVFDIEDDGNFPNTALRTTPASGLTLRYPMTETTQPGVTHFLEPLVQFAWSDVIGNDVPNEESRFAEFDEGNLLSLSRFPALDRREEGFRMAYGVNWSRFADNGWDASASLGQVLRTTAETDFSPSTGLDGTTSDFLIAGEITLEDALTFTARTLLDGAFDATKAEIRGDWTNDIVDLKTSYLWLDEDLDQDRAEPSSEIWFDGTYAVSRHWSARANWRYDLADNESTRAGFGMTYRNECVEVDLSVRRRFTSSSTVEPSTDFGFTIALLGFNAPGETERYAGKCS